MPTPRKLLRREFLVLAGGAVSAIALGGCASPTAAVVTATPTAGPVPTATEEIEPLTITIVYNNIPQDARLNTAWGFSALIECGDHTVLFDTGGDSPMLLSNMATLGIGPATIQQIVLSHIHDDHIGGLSGLLETGVRPPVYVPPSFPDSFKDPVSEITELVEVTPGQEIAPGIFSTGEMFTPGHPSLVEQALVVKSRGGWVVVTGCAHPGIVSIVERAQELLDGPMFLVMGGFHLGDKDEAQLNAILARLRQLGVERVAPSHCTGELAIRMFAEEYADKFIQSGAGTIINIQHPRN